MFAKRFLIGVLAVVVLLALMGAAFAGDQNFPVGLWQVDGGNAGLPPSDIAQLRWHGIDFGIVGGVTDTFTNWDGTFITRNIQSKLARYDSLGVRIWLCPTKFNFSYPVNGTPRNYGMDVRGHWPAGNPSHQYFVSQGRGPNPGGGGDPNYQTPLSSGYWSPQGFSNSLDSAMQNVVDSVKNAHALWGYIYWDEFNSHHIQQWTYPYNFYWWQQPWMRYWENVWMDSAVGQLRLPDNMGVGSWLKWKIEHRDTLHSVCQNLNACSDWGNCLRTYTTLRYRGPGADTTTSSNNPKNFTNDNFMPYSYNVAIGDTNTLKWNCTSLVDTAVLYAKAANPANPIKIFATQIQEWGSLNGDQTQPRITTPEEVRELANLGVLHEIKGILYFCYGTFGSWANLVDENNVPFDALYKEYVYSRSNAYSQPNQLRPFNPSDPIHDPFRTVSLPPPDTTLTPKGKENYNLWKYAPYARNWNFMRNINDPLKIIAPHLPNIWKVGQRITRVVPDFGGPPGPLLPEYVTFSDSLYNNPPTHYAFLVSKDFTYSQWGDSVIVNLPSPPPGQTYYVLDLNSRHLIPSTGRINFHTVLKSGEGRLFKFVLAGNPQGGGAGPLQAGYVPNPYNGSMWNTLLVTDPDISFHKSGQTAPIVQFTEGDTVVLSATVYNLGFANKTDSVKFYLGDPLAGGTFLGGSSVTVPALSTSDTLPKSVTVTYSLVTNYYTHLGPYDVNVILKGATSSAHSLLWLNAEDYSTKVNGSPWNMDETKPNQDIASYTSFVSLTDSISSCWEGMTNTLPPPPPTLHFRLASSIDASKYKMMQFKVFSDSAESVTVRWSPNGGTPPMSYLPPYQWQVITVPLVNYGWSGSVTDFYLQFPSTGSMNNRKIRLAWAKLTTR